MKSFYTRTYLQAMEDVGELGHRLYENVVEAKRAGIYDLEFDEKETDRLIKQTIKLKELFHDLPDFYYRTKPDDL